MSTERQPGTVCGISSIGALPWGTHLCHFYLKHEDLVCALVPFFKAGLENGERCLWVTADPLRAVAARAELSRVVPGLDARIERGDIAIRDYDTWYTTGEQPRGEAVVGQWLKEEERALAAGYSGLRLTGNTSFLRPETWAGFLDYERAVTEAFRHRRILALCSYPLIQCRGADVFDVVKRHPLTLDCRDGEWDVVETAHHRFI